MSRAFTSENDGWRYCQEKRRSCMFADERGKCLISKCKYDRADDEKEPQKQSKHERK